MIIRFIINPPCNVVLNEQILCVSDIFAKYCHLQTTYGEIIHTVWPLGSAETLIPPWVINCPSNIWSTSAQGHWACCIIEFAKLSVHVSFVCLFARSSSFYWGGSVEACPLLFCPSDFHERGLEKNKTFQNGGGASASYARGQEEEKID